MQAVNRWILAALVCAVAGSACGRGASGPVPGRTPTPAAVHASAAAGPARTPGASPAASGARAAGQTPVSIAAPLSLAGCPPAPSNLPPPGPPWHPAVLVPDSRLPAPVAPAAGTPSLWAVQGKGMWIWQWPQTEGGSAAAVVRRARAAGLQQLWVRVGDSRDGFYAADELAALVPAAHSAGIAVIAWGFPFLYDPVDDAAWSTEVLAWRGPGGARVDGFSADIETASEGVMLSDLRVAVYLGLVRQRSADRPLVGTVYPPTDRWWSSSYPFLTIGRYVDAFAVMEYWECRQPGDAAAQALARLAPLRPVHLVGQAFSFGPAGGRVPAPSAAEEQRFLDTARDGGAVGASFWVWQLMNAEEWSTVGGYTWSRPQS